MKENIKAQLGNKFFIIAVFCMYLIMIWFSYTYKMDPYLWFDEAGQFWISKGLNHDSAPYSSIGNIWDVIKNNQDYNLDPGGFSILLHFWSMISNHFIWLRSLPFLLFVCTIIGWIYLTYQWTNNKNTSLLLGFVPLIIPMIYNEAFEVRAYSMEVLGCILVCIATDKLQKKVSYKRLVMWSSLVAIFMTSRYSFIIVTFVFSTYVLYLIYKSNKSRKEQIIMITIYSLPILLSLGYVYFFAMRHQNPEVSTLHYLPYLSENIKIVLRIASLRHIFYLLLISWGAYELRNSWIINKYIGLIYITIVTNVLFVILSLLGYHPWSGDTTRCISMIVLIIISFTAILGEGLRVINKYVDFRLIVLCFICIRLLSLYKFDVKNVRHRENSLTHYQQINAIGKVYVDRWESPCMRYQFEYGKLVNDMNYPNMFTFAVFRPHRLAIVETEKRVTLSDYYKTQPDLDDLEQYSVLIVPELFDYKQKVPLMWNSINNQNRVWIKK